MHILTKKAAAPGSLSELLRVALPLVVSAGSASMMYVIDRVFLTWYSTDAVAASLPATMLHWTVMSLALGTAQYVNTFVAQYDGAGQYRRVGAVVWQGIYFSLFSGLLLAALAPFASQAFVLFDHAPEILKLETEFFSVLCYGATPLLISTSLACFYSGRGKTLIIMCANLLSAGVNILLDYWFIFGGLGLRPGGVKGAALATLLSWVVGALFYVVTIANSRQRKQYALDSGWRFDRELFARLLRFGLPNGFQFLVDVAGFTIFVQLIGRLGKHELAASSLAFNLNTLAFIPLFGLGTAVMTLTGQRIGQGRPELAVRTTWFAFGLATIHTMVFAAIYLFAPHWILWPYAWGERPAEFASLQSTVVMLLRFVAVYAFFDAMGIVFGSATRGAGDTRFALLFSVITGSLLLVLPTWLWLAYGPKGLFGPWVIVTIFVAVVGFGFLARFLQGRWKTMRVIERKLG